MTDSGARAAEWSAQDEASMEQGWPLRPLMLAALGLVTGLIAHFVLGESWIYNVGREPGPQTLAALAAVTVTAGVIGFTIERRLWWAALVFALICGVVAGAVVWWNGPVAGWSGGDGWRILCLFLAIAIAAPLFQAGRDAEALRFPYASVHDHAWTNIVLWGACWVFVGITFALMLLLGQLFHLIKIDFLKDLLDRYWFDRALLGLAFGGALGLLREHGAVVRLLQRVVAMVLAVLAPVLAVGLLLFVLALPFTGLSALWDATSATTPILLACVVGALILANAVIGDVPEHERRSPALRYGAMGLALVMLPLAVIAAIAVGLRIGQYGFTPERLWALTFVIIATAFGLAYLVSLVRGRLNWAEKVRPANLVLAFAVCGIALLLATPLVSFNAISTRDQVARLEAGKIASDQFDWAALAFDFGAPGKAALAKLGASKNPVIAARASKMMASTNRWQVREADEREDRNDRFGANLRVLPVGTKLPSLLRERLSTDPRCTGETGCTMFLEPGGEEAFLLSDGCFADRLKCVGGVQRYVLQNHYWTEPREMTLDQALNPPRDTAYRAGELQVRPVQRRQLFIGGVAVGEPFE